MAGDWIPAEVNLPRKIEVVNIAKRFGCSRFEVVGRLIEFWAWAQSVAHERLLARLTLDDIAATVGQPVEFFKAVAQEGWLAETPEGVEIVNGDWWLEKGSKARLLKTKRQQSYRTKKKAVDADVDAPPSTKASTNVEECREEKSISKHPSDASSADADTPPAAPADEVQFVVNWNNAPGVQRVAPINGRYGLTPKRRAKFRARCREPGWDFMAALAKFPLAFWQSIDRKPDLDWFLRPDSVTRIIEGLYDTPKRESGRRQQSFADQSRYNAPSAGTF